MGELNFERGDGMENPDTILWRGIQFPGHEACRIGEINSEWHIQGSAAFSYGQQPCLLRYEIICDSTWQTHSAEVGGWVGNRNISIQLKTDSDLHWWLNGEEEPEVKGCIDVDLNFSPSTNLIPVRRLNLKVGERADLTAAWLKFPSFSLEPLPQSYERLEELVYRYTSNNGRFVADLHVNHTGFATDYPGIWVMEDGSV